MTRQEMVEEARSASLAKVTFKDAPEVPIEIVSAVWRAPKPGAPAVAVNINERFVYKRGSLIVYVYYDPGLGLSRDEREAMKGVL